MMGRLATDLNVAQSRSIENELNNIRKAFNNPAAKRTNRGAVRYGGIHCCPIGHGRKSGGVAP